MNIDQRLFFRLFNLSKEHTRLSKTMAFITLKSSYFYKALYSAALLYGFLYSRTLIVPLLLGPALSLVTVRAIRLFYKRRRPFAAHGFKSIIAHEDNSSFPSQHASSAFAIALGLWYINPSLGVFALIVAFITGLSRVMVGVHYPFDVTFGAIVGILTTYIAFFIFT
jgi:undecaprenyl-diphosphatase